MRRIVVVCSTLDEAFRAGVHGFGIFAARSRRAAEDLARAMEQMEAGLRSNDHIAYGPLTWEERHPEESSPDWRVRLRFYHRQECQQHFANPPRVCGRGPRPTRTNKRPPRHGVKRCIRRDQ